MGTMAISYTPGGEMALHCGQDAGFELVDRIRLESVAGTDLLRRKLIFHDKAEDCLRLLGELAGTENAPKENVPDFAMTPSSARNRRRRPDP